MLALREAVSVAPGEAGTRSWASRVTPAATISKAGVLSTASQRDWGPAGYLSSFATFRLGTTISLKMGT